MRSVTPLSRRPHTVGSCSGNCAHSSFPLPDPSPHLHVSQRPAPHPIQAPSPPSPLRLLPPRPWRRSPGSSPKGHCAPGSPWTQHLRPQPTADGEPATRLPDTRHPHLRSGANPHAPFSTSHPVPTLTLPRPRVLLHQVLRGDRPLPLHPWALVSPPCCPRGPHSLPGHPPAPPRPATWFFKGVPAPAAEFSLCCCDSSIFKTAITTNSPATLPFFFLPL